MTSLIRVFDADNIFYYNHSCLSDIHLYTLFTHQYLLALLMILLRQIFLSIMIQRVLCQT